jgi:hypothetical protein
MTCDRSCKVRRPKDALNEAEEGRIGPGSYHVEDDAILGSVRRAKSSIGTARPSPWALQRGLTQEEARFKSSKFRTPGPGDYNLSSSQRGTMRRQGMGTVTWTAQPRQSQRQHPVWQLEVAENRTPTFVSATAAEPGSGRGYTSP